MIEIRKAQVFDLPHLYNICVKTGNSGTDATNLFNDPFMLGHFYASPYLFAKEACNFVAVVNGTVQGYILCAKNTKSFNAWLCTWLEPIANNYRNGFVPKTETEKSLLEEIIFYKNDFCPPFLEEYPAHLHIDLLPSLQGKGAGKLLIKTLLEELKKENIKGLHLGVDAKNEKAINFYKKCGFSVLEKTSWGFYMGLKL